MGILIKVGGYLLVMWPIFFALGIWTTAAPANGFIYGLAMVATGYLSDIRDAVRAIKDPRHDD
jgi:hypothetical protein